jgi:hypothetical protein
MTHTLNNNYNNNYNAYWDHYNAAPVSRRGKRSGPVSLTQHEVKRRREALEEEEKKLQEELKELSGSDSDSDSVSDSESPAVGGAPSHKLIGQVFLHGGRGRARAIVKNHKEIGQSYTVQGDTYEVETAGLYRLLPVDPLKLESNCSFPTFACLSNSTYATTARRSTGSSCTSSTKPSMRWGSAS